MPQDWTDISYLLQGTPRQQEAYHALEGLGIFAALSEYGPVLAGTIPLDIDIPGSDLDIACEAHDLNAFSARLVATYGDMPGFSVRRTEKQGLPSVVVAFSYQGFPVEIFAQSLPVAEQNAYRHMLNEAAYLGMGGKEARDAIRALKLSGLKTEPAFAQYFRLSGDPYKALLVADVPAHERPASGRSAERT